MVLLLQRQNLLYCSLPLPKRGWERCCFPAVMILSPLYLFLFLFPSAVPTVRSPVIKSFLALVFLCLRVCICYVSVCVCVCVCVLSLDLRVLCSISSWEIQMHPWYRHTYTWSRIHTHTSICFYINMWLSNTHNRPKHFFLLLQKRLSEMLERKPENGSQQGVSSLFSLPLHSIQHYFLIPVQPSLAKNNCIAFKKHSVFVWCQ